MRFKNAIELMILLLVGLSCSQNKSTGPDFYLNLIDVNIGPFEYDNTSGRFNRVLINNFDGRLNLIVEKIITDDEGFDKKLDKRIVINNLFFESEVIYRIEVIEWLDTDTFLVSRDSSCYKVEILSDDVKIERGCQ